MILRLNDTGLAVGDLQRRLYSIGFTKIEQNNIYDDKTKGVVSDLQKKHGLVADGIYGPKTEAVLLGREAGKLLKQSDIVAAAKALDVPVAAVMAVNEVESRGLGFLKDWRPVILFERHVFYKQLVSRKIDARSLANKYPGIINQKRGGYAGGAAEYMRLSVAVSINQEAAYESCSWGLFQIMGLHWESLGYPNVLAFVKDQQENEPKQLQTFVKFIQSDSALLKSLRSQDWDDFARRYNGPAYAQNLYDVKLARAYAKYQSELKEAA